MSTELRHSRTYGQRVGWAIGTALVACVLLADVPLAQMSGAKPTGRLNRIIEQFQKGQSSFGGEHWQLTSLEHDPFLIDNLEQNLAKVQSVGGARPAMTPIVRIAHEGDQDFKHVVKQFLDVGAFGIILPHVNNTTEVLRLVSAMRYPNQRGAKYLFPVGIRGSGAGGALRVWGLSADDYARKADVWPLNPEGELLAMIMIETREAVEHIDELLSVPGLGGVMIGASDLSLSLGVGTPAGAPEAPETLAAIARVGKACMAHKTVICGSFQAPDLKGMQAQGFKLFTRANDPSTQSK
jgi:4-hydroxy-2-oxoheptanedioate aldolase